LRKELRNAGITYLITWVIAFAVLTSLAARGERTVAEAALLFFEVAFNTNFLIAVHSLFVLLFIAFLITRYFRRIFRKKGAKPFFRQLMYRFALPIVFIVLVFKTLVFANSNENYAFSWDDLVMNDTKVTNDHYNQDAMHRGMSVFGWSDENNEASIDALIKANVEWVAVIPFMDQKDEASKTIRLPKTSSWTRRDSVFIKSIQVLRSKGLHVQLKPHLWLGSGWRSNLSLNSDAEWNAWFDSYEKNMLRYARMAELTGAELFCIGTELKSSIKKQPERWRSLITKIKTVYSGKLTYAANWHDEYEHIDFWNELDFIGIQAYFPLTKTKKPDLVTIEKGWARHIDKLEKLYQVYNKPILFTEIGYKSDASATIKPWEWGSFLSVLSEKKSDQTQQLAFEALFKQLWHKKWFAGVYIWQWHTRSKKEDAPSDLDFSPRYKPAENTIAKWFSKPVTKSLNQ